MLRDVKDDTYSIFYGQDYTNDHFKYAFYGPLKIKNLHDLQDVPEIKTSEEVSTIFERYHQAKSGLSVFQIVNSVWVLRQFS